MAAETEPNAAEFDASQYPEKTGCNIMPQVEAGVAEVEVLDADQRGVHFTVPSTAVMSLKVHTITDQVPELDEHFKEHLGAGLVACKLVERFPDYGLVKIELPGSTQKVLIPEKQLARKV